MRTGGGGAGDSRQGALLNRFYRQVTRRQGARLGPGYDITAGGHRLSGRPAGRTVRPAEILDGPRGKHVNDSGPRAGRDADGAVAALYGQYYAALVRLASLLVDDVMTAEEIVQDSFVALHASRRMLRDGDGALLCLRRSVLHRSRSAARRRTAAEQKAPGRANGGPAGPQRASAAPGGPAIISALRGLPARQREAVVMRYCAGLPEARVAQVMGISRRAARQHTERAVAALRGVLDTAGGPALLDPAR